MSRTVLITGANRGIGLALARLYLSRGDRVIGVCRTASKELSATGAQVESGVDITSDEHVTALARRLEGTPIDILVANAGVLGHDDLEDVDLADVLRQFEVNALGPLRTVQKLLPNLRKGAKIALITSRMGSIGDNGSGGYYGYRMSKAALNAAGVSLARDLAPRGVSVAILHPGHVRTEMTGGTGDLTADESAALLATRIDGLSEANTGTFWHARGQTLPW